MLAPLEAELDWLGGAVGPARDYDVFVGETLRRIGAQFRGEPELDRLRARAARKRRKLRRAAREACAAPRFQKLLLALGAFLVELLKLVPAADEAKLARTWVPPLLQEHHRKLRKRTRHVHRLEAAERHRARVAAKKLRYAAEFFSSLFSSKRAADYIAAVSRLQGALGRLNDLAVATQLLQDVTPAGEAELAHARGIVRGWLAASIAPELDKLRQARRRFAECEPFWD
jgi:CHAD domain-containing protein